MTNDPRIRITLQRSGTDIKVTESNFDGGVIDDEIEGVGEGQTVACLPTER